MASEGRARWLGAGLAVAVLALGACGGTNAFTGIDVSAGSVGGSAVVAVQVTPDTLRFTDLGQSSQLLAVAVDSTGNQVTTATVAWSSSDTGIATVATDGTVTSTGVGTATITAAAGDVKGSSTVVVTTPAGVSPPG